VALTTPFAKSVHSVEQVVVEDPPAGDYEVEVVAELFPANAFNELRSQPFALVFVGSGTEVPFTVPPLAGPIPMY
jgi:hypothetical protein